MYTLKTKPTRVRVSTYIHAIADKERRDDCRTLVAILRRVTGCRPRMWGPSIVGFGTYHYEYATGHHGDMCEAGFSSRRPDIVLYVLNGRPDPPTKRLLASLGKHTIGKSCLYVRRLADVRLSVLEQLAKRSVADVRRRYPKKRS